MLNSQETHLIETSYDRLKSRNHIFNNTRKILLKQEFSDRFPEISMNIKDITTTFDNSLLFTEHSEHYTKSFHAKSAVQFLPCQHRERWHLMQARWH